MKTKNPRRYAELKHRVLLSLLNKANEKGVKMEPKKMSQALAEILRTAQPRLICRVDPEDDQRFRLTPFISDVERGWDEIIDEGFDPDHSPLGPVYWRIIKRGDERFYCSTYLATRDEIVRGWGTRGLAYRNPVIGMAVAQIETSLAVPVSRQ